jgi:hypothetical protein
LARQPSSRDQPTISRVQQSMIAPFLYVDATNHFSVYVPHARIDSAGITCELSQTPGRSIPIEDFFIARRPTPRTRSTTP